MKIKTQYIAALVLAVGGTMTAWAGPGVGPYGPWNSGGAFGGFGPYQPYLTSGCQVQEGLRTTVFLKRATCSSPVRTRTFITPAPVAETILEAPAPVAERVIIRRTRCAPLRTTRVITSERIVRPTTFRRLTTRCIPRRDLDVVGERIITPEPVVERVVTPAPVMELAPSCPVGADWDYANPYR